MLQRATRTTTHPHTRAFKLAIRSRVGAVAAIALIAVTTIAGAGIAPAAVSAAGVHTWTGAGDDNLWSNAANWDVGVSPNVGDDITFPDGAAQPTSINDFPDGSSFSVISVLGAGYNLTGNPLVSTGFILADYTAGTSTMWMDIALANPNFIVQDASRLVLNGVLSGDYGITKAGTGRLALTRDNTFGGVVSIPVGSIEISANGALGAEGPGNETTVNFGSSLILSNSVNVTETIYLGSNGPGGGIGGLHSQDGANFVQHIIVVDTSTISSASELHVDQTNQTAGAQQVSIVGPGIVVLDNNIFHGSTTVTSGTTLVRGHVNGAATVESGGTMWLAADWPFGYVQFLTGNGGTIMAGTPGAPRVGYVGTLELADGTTFMATLGGNSPAVGGAPGYSQLVVTDDVVTNISDATLNVSLVAGYVPVTGQPHKIIDAPAGVTGVFTGLPDGAQFQVGPTTFRIDYDQGVTLTAVDTSTVALMSSPNPSSTGASATFEATVAGGGTSGIAATGTVSFFDGATLFGSAAVTAGITTFSTSALTHGTHSITARYSGDLLYASSTSAALVHIVNIAPVPAYDGYSTPEETPLTVDASGVLGNDYDGDGDTLTAELVTAPTMGAVELADDGSFVYAPYSNATGQDFFEYRVWDGYQWSSTMQTYVYIDSVNDAPVAVADTYSLAEDVTFVASVSVLGNDSDVDGDLISAELVTGVSHGTLSLPGHGWFTYTPAAEFSGVDTFSYRTYDGTAYSAAVTVTLNVAPLDDPPVGHNDAYGTIHDVTLSVPAPGVLGNDTDVDTLPAALTAAILSQPAHGLVVLSQNGALSYTPDTGFHGIDTFTYTPSDASGPGQAATVTITVNGAPTATADTYGMNEDTPLTVAAPGVIDNDGDPDDDTLIATLLTGVGHGALSFADDGSFSYSPDLDWFGTDSFSYEISDGPSSASATVTLRVAAINDAPVAGPVAPADTTNGAPMVVAAPGPLAGATDADGDPLTAVLVTGPAHGTLVLNADGSYAYTPDAGFVGTDSFVYAASDGVTQSNSVTITINVAAAAPVPGPTPVPTNPAVTPLPPVTAPSGDLPATGWNMSPTLLLAGMMLAAGIALLSSRRRRGNAT